MISEDWQEIAKILRYPSNSEKEQTMNHIRLCEIRRWATDGKDEQRSRAERLQLLYEKIVKDLYVHHKL